jgi:hypothetical protein
MRCLKFLYLTISLLVLGTATIWGSLFSGRITNSRADAEGKMTKYEKYAQTQAGISATYGSRGASGITTTNTYNNVANSTDEVTAQIASSLAGTLSSLASTSSTLAGSLSSQTAAIEAAASTFLSSIVAGSGTILPTGNRGYLAENYQKKINRAITFWKNASGARKASYAKQITNMLDSCGTTSGTGCTYPSGVSISSAYPSQD